VETTVVTGARTHRDRRHKRHSEWRDEKGTTALKRLALVALAEETQVYCDPLMTERASVVDDIYQQLALWTYIRELVRRTEFASQGPPVYRLWLEIDERTRKNLTVQLVWQARERLLEWFKNNAALN